MHPEESQPPHLHQSASTPQPVETTRSPSPLTSASFDLQEQFHLKLPDVTNLPRLELEQLLDYCLQIQPASADQLMPLIAPLTTGEEKSMKFAAQFAAVLQDRLPGDIRNLPFQEPVTDQFANLMLLASICIRSAMGNAIYGTVETRNQWISIAVLAWQVLEYRTPETPESLRALHSVIDVIDEIRIALGQNQFFTPTEATVVRDLIRRNIQERILDDVEKLPHSLPERTTLLEKLITLAPFVDDGSLFDYLLPTARRLDRFGSTLFGSFKFTDDGDEKNDYRQLENEEDRQEIADLPPLESELPPLEEELPPQEHDYHQDIDDDAIRASAFETAAFETLDEDNSTDDASFWDETPGLPSGTRHDISFEYVRLYEQTLHILSECQEGLQAVPFWRSLLSYYPESSGWKEALAGLARADTEEITPHLKHLLTRCIHSRGPDPSYTALTYLLTVPSALLKTAELLSTWTKGGVKSIFRGIEQEMDSFDLASWQSERLPSELLEHLKSAIRSIRK